MKCLICQKPFAFERANDFSYGKVIRYYHKDADCAKNNGKYWYLSNFISNNKGEVLHFTLPFKYNNKFFRIFYKIEHKKVRIEKELLMFEDKIFFLKSFDEEIQILINRFGKLLLLK